MARRPVRGAFEADWRANHRELRGLFLLTSFRFTQRLMGDLDSPRWWSWLPIALHRFLSEFMLQMELRPRTSVGPGLTIHHGFGLVVNDGAVIGNHVTLRNGVSIGHARRGGGSPRIGDHVDIGAGAIVIGEIVVGHDAIIGAGAVVVRDVPVGAVVAGNPARVLRAPIDGESA